MQSFTLKFPFQHKALFLTNYWEKKYVVRTPISSQNIIQDSVINS
jgi:hypothetical protein